MVWSPRINSNTTFTLNSEVNVRRFFNFVGLDIKSPQGSPLRQCPTFPGPYKVLSVLALHEWFGIEGAIKDPCEALLIIVENEGHKVALLVDELITQNQAVIKSLEANYRKVDGITGATILGDGRVALIIDVPGLLRGMNNERGLATRAA